MEFCLLSVRENAKKYPFLPKRAKQKIFLYFIKNAIDPLTGENYGDCKYKVNYINNNYVWSNLTDMNDTLIKRDDIGKRFYAELINYLDDLKFQSMFNLA